MPEQASERKAATPRDPSHDEAANLLAPKDTDDVVVRFFKHLALQVQERWRVLTLLLTVIIVVAGIVAYNVQTQRTRAEKDWRDFRDATTVDALEKLAPLKFGREVRPYILLDIVERYRAGENAELKPADRTKKILETIANFKADYAQDSKFAFELARLEALENELKAREPVLARFEKSAAEKKPEHPAATVIVPELDENGQWKPMANPEAVIKTKQGELRVELLEDRAPNTVANFLWLVEQGFYDLDGPGGNITVESTATVPRRLLVGTFPLADAANSTKTYQQVKAEPNPDPRVDRLDAKWITRFDKRSVGYTIPFEAGATMRRVPAGSLVMKLDTAQSVPSTPLPNSASAQFFITLEPNAELDGRYVVFGRLAGDESFAVARQLPPSADILVAYASRVRPEMRRRQVAWLDATKQIHPIDLPRLVEQLPWGLALAPTWESADFIELQPFVSRRVTETQTTQNEDGTTTEKTVTVEKQFRQVEIVPMNVWYRDPSGNVVQAANSPTVVDHFPADLTPATDPQPAAKLLTPRAVVYQADGSPKAREYRPQVKYAGFPTTVAAQTTPPEEPKPLYLFGETPPPPPQPRRPPGDMPQGLPPGFDPSQFMPQGGGR